jgi:hypothetical protein
MANSLANAPTVTLGRDITADQEDMYVRGLPKEIREYLKFDSPIDWCPRFTYSCYRKHGKDVTLHILKSAAKDDTLALYGSSHPQVRRSIC